MSLLETDVTIENVITTDPEKARALENNVRAKILDMLADESMTVEEITDELARRGEDKAETTVRHHVNVLRDAGLIELARLAERGGATVKYYQANTRVFSYDLPEAAEDELAEAFETTRTELKGFIRELVDEHGDEIEAVAKEMKPCEYCKTQHYEEYLIRELLNRALTDLSENGNIDDVFH